MTTEIPLDGNLPNTSYVEGFKTDEELAAFPLFLDYSSELLDFAGACCIIFMLVGIPGNMITIWALARYKKVRNATAIFIINLSVADLLFCCINLPLAATTFFTRKWPLGIFMCQFFPFARFSLAGVSIFTVLAITANRYIMISHPRFYPRMFTPLTLGIIIAITWIISIVSLIPTWLDVWGQFGMDRKSTFCVVLKDHEGHSPMKLLFICSFVIPLLTIIICYARIFYVVRKTTAKSRGTTQNKNKGIQEDTSFASSTAERSPDSEVVPALRDGPPEHPRVQSLRPPSTARAKVSIVPEDIPRSKSTGSHINFARAINLRKSQLLNMAAPSTKDKRLLTMISAIMITFFVCHLPITIIKVFSELTEPPPSAIIWSYLLRYLTTCINPIIYVVMSYEYRKAYRKAIMMPSCKNKLCLPR